MLQNIPIFIQKQKRIIIFIITLLSFLFFFTSNISRRPDDRVKGRIILLAVGDTGTGEESQKKVAGAMRKTCRSSVCDAIVLLGDIIYPSGVTTTQDAQFQTKFENIYSDLSLPFYVSFGNHDYLGCVECYIAYSTMSARWKMPNYYYKQSFGDLIDLFVLDTENLNQEQVSWVNNEIKKSRSQWKIIAGHHPLISHDKRHGNATEDKKILLEQILCNKVDVYLAGHAHNLEDAGDACGARLLIAGGGGAPVGDVEPNKSPFIAPTYGFILITATNTELSATFYNEKGKILYAWNKNR